MTTFDLANYGSDVLCTLVVTIDESRPLLREPCQRARHDMLNILVARASGELGPSIATYAAYALDQAGYRELAEKAQLGNLGMVTRDFINQQKAERGLK